MSETATATAVLSRKQLDILQEHVDAGADPWAVARWISRITATGRLSVAQIAGAAEDLQLGYRDHLYAAAAAQRRQRTEGA
jgi:hypothetical protein